MSNITKWSGIHQSIEMVRQRLINDELVLMYVSTQQESTLDTCCDVLLHNCEQFVIGYETYISVLLKNFIRVLTFKVLTAFH